MVELKGRLAGLVAKIEGNADLLGGGLGLMQHMLYDQSKYGYDIIENIKFKLSKWKLVNPIDVLKREFHPDHKERYADPIVGGVTVTVLAWLLRELGLGGVHPIAERSLRFAQKAGIAYSLGVAISGMVWLPSDPALVPAPTPVKKSSSSSSSSSIEVPYVYGR